MTYRYYIIKEGGINIAEPAPKAIYAFNSNVSEYVGTFVGGSYCRPILDDNASPINGFYSGYILFYPFSNEQRWIIGYDGTTRTLTIDEPFASGVRPSTRCEIRDPSSWYHMHLQFGASCIDNMYNKCQLVDVKLGRCSTIYGYNGTTKIANVTSLMVPDRIELDMTHCAFSERVNNSGQKRNRIKTLFSRKRKRSIVSPE